MAIGDWREVATMIKVKALNIKGQVDKPFRFGRSKAKQRRKICKFDNKSLSEWFQSLASIIIGGRNRIVVSRIGKFGRKIAACG